MQGVVDLLEIVQPVPFRYQLAFLTSLELGRINLVDLKLQHIQMLRPFLLIRPSALQRGLELGIRRILLGVFLTQLRDCLPGKLVEHPQVLFRLHELLVFILAVDIHRRLTNPLQRIGVDQHTIHATGVASIRVNLALQNHAAIIMVDPQFIEDPVSRATGWKDKAPLNDGFIRAGSHKVSRATTTSQ